MALPHVPHLLVLDEPTTGVDPVSRAELWRLIARAAAEGAAVVIATSYVDEAERAENVVVLSGGDVLLSGPPHQIVASIPGALFESRDRPRGVRSWRRGEFWRAWSPERGAFPGSGPARADLEDAVIVAEMRHLARAPEKRQVVPA
jgi:ABC-2 type transport system ATP-binding protein